MYIPEKGVNKNSNIYFHSPSDLAKEVFLYCTCVGEFFCSEEYKVKRKSFHSYLLMYIAEGEGYVSDGKCLKDVHAGDLVLLNCHKPHQYFTTQGWHTYWIHFDGQSASQFYEYIMNFFGCTMSLDKDHIIPHLLLGIIDSFKHKTPLPEGLMSSYIHRILTEVITFSAENLKSKDKNHTPIADSLQFIHTHFSKKIKVKDMAQRVNMSPYHFSRIFRRETGYSPYDYLINLRINHSKILLERSSLNIKQITFKIGFNSESNYVSTFKERIGVTPKEYRHIKEHQLDISP